MKSFEVKKQSKLSKSVLSNIDGLSYSAIMKLLRSKDVKVNGVRVNKDIQVNVGDKVEVYAKDTFMPTAKVIFEDDNVLVVDKPSGVLSETLFDNLKEKYNELFFIHRLDRNTSGLMIFAKNTDAEKSLLLGFKNHTFIKKYLATVYGEPKENKKVLTAYLLKDKDASLVKIFDKKVAGSVEIKTGYEVKERYLDTSLLEVTLFTGKTHQIRAHLAHIGHFIVGDGKYGNGEFNRSKKVSTQMLKAYKLTLNFDKNDFLYYLDKKTFVSE